MSGYEGSHQDWLEDQAADQLERETFERERSTRGRVDGSGWEIIRDGTHWTVETEWLSQGEMTLLAHAILAEVEIAQKGDDDGTASTES